MQANSTALVTGGAGFLGSHLCERLMGLGYRVVAVDNLCTGLRSNVEFLRALPEAAEKFRFFEADVVQDWKFWNEIPQEWRENLAFILHFASPASPPLYQRLSLETMWVNTIGLRNALEHVRQTPGRVVFASTSEIYGDPLVSPQPETYWGNVNTIGPRACYDEAKRFGESLIYTSNQRFQREDGIVRIFNTYGPRMNPADGRVVINFLVQALKGQKLSIYGNGRQTRSFCYVDDLIEAILRFAESGNPGPINIGNDVEFTILELAEAVRSIYPERKLELEFLDAAIDDPQRRRPDLTRARALLDWSPQVPLQAGLRAMLEWVRSQPRDL